MDFQKDDDEDGDDEQRVKRAILLLSLLPGHQFRHSARRIERGGCREDDAQASSILVEGFDVVGKGFPVSPMSFIFDRVREQIPMQLADVVFVKRDCVEGREDRLHHLGIAGNLLFVSAGERADTEVREQPFDLAVA